MKRLILAAALALAATPAMAQEHRGSAEVVSVPADDAVLAQAPRVLSLTFAHPVVLSEVQLHGPGDASIPVSFTPSASATASYSIALPALLSGAYEVHWKATGDGHGMEGELHFTVQ